jgi:hypothetical protein
VEPSLAWTPLTKNFGSINVGSSSSTQTFTLTNSGTASATGCSAPSLTNTTDFTINTDNCGTADLAGSSATCTVIVQANPTTSGAKTATLSRTCSFGGTASTTTDQIVVTGAAPSLAWSPLTNDFGDVDVGSSSSDQTFTLTNSGAATATGCSAPIITDTTNFTIATDNCGTANLASGAATCTVLIHGNPTTLGAHATTLSRTCTFGGTAATTSNQIILNGTTSYVPTVAITAPDAGTYLEASALTTLAISGTCSESGRDVVLSGAADSTVTCTAGHTWSTTVDVSGKADGTLTFYADHDDSLGTAAVQASRAFVKDTTAPTFTASEMSLNGGVSPSLSIYIPVAFGAVDDGAPITNYCLKYNSTTAPVAADSCWISITPTASYSANVNFRLGFAAGSYSVYAWAKNASGLISSLTNSGAGTDAQDKASITFSPVLPPSLINVSASSADGSVNLTVSAGGDVYVKWNASSSGSLAATPISVYYTTDDTNYTEVATSLANAPGSGCTITGAETGCYKWASGAPTSSYFRVRVGAIDTNGRLSYQTTQPLNIGTTLRVIAGSTDPGTGGSATAAIFVTPELNQGWQDPGSFIVSTSGVVYFADSVRGILKVDPSDGVQNLIIPATPSTTAVDGAVPGTATVRNVYRLSFDSQGRVLMFDYDRIRRYDPVANTVTTIIGGGGSTAATVAPLSLQIDPAYYSGWPLLFFGTPDGKIYFQSQNYNYVTIADYRLRIYDPVTDLVTSLTFSGTGDAYDPAQDITLCGAYGMGATYNPVSGALLQIILKSNHNLTGCQDSGDHFPFMAINPTTGVSSGPHPAGTSYSDNFNVGADGKLYLIDRISGTVKQYDSSTRVFTTILGVYTSPGVCADGTTATACQIDVSDFYADANGVFYFFERGKIRTIDQNGKVQTVMGSGFTAGDGGLATSARLGSITDVKLWNDGSVDKVVLTDQSEYRIREFDIDGNIQTLAGNGSHGHPNTTAAAAGQPIAVNDNSSVSILHIQVDPTAGTIYSSARINNYISKIDRSTGKWVDIVGGGATNFYSASADGKLGNEIYLNGYSPAMLGFDGTHLLTAIDKYLTVSMMKIYAVTDGTQTAFAGVSGSTDTTFSADGTAGTSTTVPLTQDPVQSAIWDAYASRWVFNSQYSDANVIRTLVVGGNIGTIATLSKTPSSFTYRHDASNNLIYYCGSSDNKLYKYNITTSTNTALTWPIVKMKCTGKDMVYSSSRGTLIFPFTQDGIGGVAEYINP